jgi:single-strand DNA-binding protein
MANLNKVMLIGNITRDPELKYLPSQTALCDIGLAVNRSWTAADGSKKEEVTFIDCACYGKVAELIAKYKKKGDPLFIERRLKLDQWEKDGQKHSKMRVVVENFQFLNRGTGMGQGAPVADPSEEGYAPRPAAAPQQRQPFRPQGRPAAAPAAPPPEMDAPSMEEDAPQIRDEDIPF